MQPANPDLIGGYRWLPVIFSPGNTNATSPAWTQGIEVESNKDPKEKRMPVMINLSSQAAKRPLADEHPDHLAEKRTKSGQKSCGFNQFADRRVWKDVEVASVTIRRNTLFTTTSLKIQMRWLLIPGGGHIKTGNWMIAFCNIQSLNTSYMQVPWTFFIANINLVQIKGFHYSTEELSSVGNLIKSDTSLKYITPSYFATGNILQPQQFNSANARSMYKRHKEVWDDAYDRQEIANTVMELIRQLVTDIRLQNGELISQQALLKPMSCLGCKCQHIKPKKKLPMIHHEWLQDDLD
ncbi:hypothetical protein BDD12DRAFT_806504 [Trichophaea hybrida]|nr:hypothetical protein BDD12DRAFT_806504 [Trichophaea hybrida]